MDYIDKIDLRIEKLKEYINSLKKLKGVTARDLVEDEDKRFKAERLLQLSIETCIDIAELLIVEQRLPAPVDSGEAIKILGKEGIIDVKFSKEFAKAVGFRNILVHDYIDINYEEVADKINNRLSDFDLFAQEVAKFLTT